MVGFPKKVDRHATMALLRTTIKQSRQQEEKKKESVLQELDLELDKVPKHRAILNSIMIGTIRPNARLAKSHVLKPKCRCGAEKEDVQHVFNDCPDHLQISEDTTIKSNKSQDKMGKRRSNSSNICRTRRSKIAE